MWRYWASLLLLCVGCSSRRDCTFVEDVPAPEIRAAVAAASVHFSEQLRDFKCDFPVYVRDTAGELDGAGRIIDGRPALLLDPAVIMRTHTSDDMPVFLTHELFHRYHFTASGFSDDDSAAQPLWRTLWTEGLATYASAALNPSHPLSEAWMTPRDLDAQVKPLMPVLARSILGQLDSVDPATFIALFTLHKQVPGEPPPRAGYYVGYRVAEELAKKASVAQMAHWDAERVRAEIAGVLQAM